jgi:hypothetical protein
MFAEVLAPAFGRREPRLRAWSYVLGLASGLERKNGWTLAEYAGDAGPDGMQRLLNAARWDEDSVRDALSRYVAARLGDHDGVLIADETGFEKTGKHSAGVQRQYTGTAGKITNCQVGVFLAYAVPAKGTRVLVDRELYIPRSWTDDRVRCARAGVPKDARFATKPQLAKKMVGRAIAAGLPFPGSPPMRPTGTTGRCGTGWKAARSPTWSRSPATTGFRPGSAARSAPTTWPRRSRSGAGSGCRAGRGRRASGCMTGRSPRLGRAATC